MEKIGKSQFISSAFWKLTEQFSTKGLSMLVSIVLARILDPNAYGLIALTAVFTNLSDILIDGGFSTTLIRKKHVDEYDFSSVWIISVSISTILYLIIFLIAPFVSSYYKEPQLTAVLRIISLLLFVQAFSVVRTAFVSRNMQFRLLFKCNFAGTVISGVLGIAAAYFGLGVWAIVIQRLSQQIVLTVMLLVKLKWKMLWKFKLSRIKEMIGFSVSVVASSLINYLSGSVCSLVIGKKYSVDDLAYYDKGGLLPTQLSLYTFSAVSSVLLPTLASYQQELELIKRIVRKVVHMTSYLIAPMMMGLALVSEELVVLLFTEKWLPIVPIMQCNCIYYFATPFMMLNVQIFFALGQSGKRVKMEIIRLVILVVGILVFGILLDCTIVQLAFFSSMVAVLSAIVTYLDVRTMIGYAVKEVLSDLIMPCVSALIMGGAIYAIDVVSAVNSNTLSLVIKILVGVGIYWGCSVVFKLDGYGEILKMLKGMVEKRENE